MTNLRILVMNLLSISAILALKNGHKSQSHRVVDLTPNAFACLFVLKQVSRGGWHPATGSPTTLHLRPNAGARGQSHQSSFVQTNMPGQDNNIELGIM